jgi:carbon storage regulator
MLVLSRKPGEKVAIGNGIIVTVLETRGGRTRIGIEVPDHIPILRGELACWLDECDAPGGAELLPAKG